MIKPTWKLVRHSEVEAYERLGWRVLAEQPIPRLKFAFSAIEWAGEGEPIMPAFPVLRPLRRNRMRAAG